jgi:hypothetical protein
MRFDIEHDEPAPTRRRLPRSRLASPLGLLFVLSACAAQGVGPASADVGDECTGDDCPPSATEAAPLAGSEGDLIARFPASGSIGVTLHPGRQAVIGRPTVVTFGVPFPPGVVSSAGQLRAFGRKSELKIHAAPLLPWRVWPGRRARESLRAALVSVEVTFPLRRPMAISLVYGSRPRATLRAPGDPRSTWVEVTDGEYPNGTVREPRVYATFSPRWLGACLFRTRTTPAGKDRSWSWFDEPMVGFARTAVNDLPASIPPENRTPYVTDHGAWLFDRTATLFGVYFRTGDVKWMRHAHRSAQFYLHHITPQGIFDLKPEPDLKYSYGRSLLMDFILTGDPALLDAIERIAAAGQDWNPVYGPRTNFWTERHQAYALLAALSAWQASGAEKHAARARKVAEVSFEMAARPQNSWHADGCMLHTMDTHEGSGGPQPVCSPWMSALFADAVWEYYIHTADRPALEFLAGLGRFVAQYGLYPGGQNVNHTMPWYLASSVKQFSDDGPWGDVEHNCDVAGMVARAAWAEKKLGRNPRKLRSTAEELLAGCRWSFENWHRPKGVSSGKPEWRLAPPRKFNWWFGSTTDLAWLLKVTR